jgi:hypothetical protein
MPPSRRVEVFFDLDDSPETETARASKIGDVLAPPPFTRVGLTTHLQTDTIQISNATGGANAITVTPFEEPQSDPELPPVEHPSFVLGFAGFETKTFDPDGLSGVSGFVGSFRFEAATPFFVASDEDFLSLDVQSPVQTRITKSPDQIASSVALRFGRETTSFGTNYWDFAFLMRNDDDEDQSVTITKIFDADGNVILDVPRIVVLAPHESRVEESTGALFGDLFGDVLVAPGLRQVQIEAVLTARVDTSFRQFDAAALGWSMTQRTIPQGHVFDVADVQGTFPAIFDVLQVMNPNDSEIVVDITALVPEPEDFDASPLLLTTLTLPPRTTQTFVLDGEFVNRDLEVVPFLGLRATSLAPFGLTSYRERRDGADLIVYITPRLVANHEVAGDY